ncbi:MAG: MBL fold metallo-hydrolase [Bacteroidia bacterium]|nr:MBL fold metallo-hydrolase [Bacteroidia bacterium]MCX7651342.1 MBL fold metallo-hydrolase [Bacteroidia bacterium]MDW8417138.1 MBL fold metallo-hydrolase [Bacteroidia bacterium]
MTPPVRFLGAGGAHDVTLGNSAALIEWEDKTFLIDCGFTVYPRLVEYRLVEKIDAICITHLHDDHIGSLSALLYHRHFLSKLPPIPIIAGSAELFAKIYTYLHFLMGEVEKFAQVLYPSEFASHVLAIPTARLHVAHMPSCAYLFTSKSMNILYSGDIGEPVPILHDAAWIAAHQPLYVFHDIAFHHTPTHCYYQALYPFLGQVRLWGYHCNPQDAPHDNKIPLVHDTFLLK